MAAVTKRLAILFALLTFSSPIAAQDTAERERGLGAMAGYGGNGQESINLFNGNLSLGIPLGSSITAKGGALSLGVNLSYNSNVWEYLTINNEIAAYVTSDTSFEGYTRAGVGWDISIPRMLAAGEVPLNSSNERMLIMGDGSRHRFYDTPYDGGTPVANYWYTRDGSHMRLRLESGGGLVVDLPDGTILKFNNHKDLKWIVDPYGNQLKFIYDTNKITIRDDHYRKIFVHFNASGIAQDMIDRVEVPKFGGGHATYQFHYDEISIKRYVDPDSQLDPYFNPNATIDVPVLEKVTLPDGATYEMDYFTQFQNQGGGNDLEVQGTIASMVLPTLGQREWTYQYYYHQNDPNVPGANTSEGIKKSITRNESGSFPKTTEYFQNLVSNRESTTIVRTPLGDETKHYFRQQDNWQLGLPISYHEPALGGHVSQKIYDGTVASGTLLRTIGATYDYDGNQWTPVNQNRRRTVTATKYHDDNDRWASTSYSDWDGLGHWRVVETDGNFPGQNERTVTTDYNAARGTYGEPGFTEFPTSDDWILHTYRMQTVDEGSETRRTRVCFNDEGRLTRLRKQEWSSSRSIDDLVTQFEYDGEGYLEHVSSYGGDGETYNTQKSCSFVFDKSNSQFWQKHSYSYGVRNKTEVLDASGSSLGFYALDLTIDYQSSVVKKSRDTALSETSYDYDSLGRILSVTPPGGWDASSFTYTKASSGVSPRVDWSRGTTAGWAKFDSYGRLSKEGMKRADGTDSVREHLYNDNGWKKSVSTWNTPTSSFWYKTEYLEYDPFGRPHRIRPPDGSQHDITFSYTGAHESSRTVQVGTGRDGTNNVTYTASTYTQRYDRFGQLYEVIEPNGVSTDYEYEMGQLVQVQTTSGSVTQQRDFEYDRRGLLLSEKHPEKGTNGYGITYYYDFDAQGRALRVTDGPNDLAFTYDRAGRPVEISEYGGSQTVLKSWTYGTSVAAGQRDRGRLLTATRHNDLTHRIPFAYDVIEEYRYGANGEPLGRETDVKVMGQSAATFDFTYNYNTLGALASIDYPVCSAGPCASAPNQIRNVSYGYANGWLTSVPGYINSTSFHVDHSMNQTVWSNGVTSQNHADPDKMGRPREIEWDTSTGESTGLYEYDGAGNIAKIGDNDYLYDVLSRITQADMDSSDQQSYTYDDFGNLTSITTNSVTRNIGVDSSTNHLTGTGIQYDGAGNQLNQIDGPANMSFSYDAFNQIKGVQDVNLGTDMLYLYAANEDRIATYDENTGIWKFMVRGLGRKVLRVFENVGYFGTIEKDYIYRGGSLIASESAADGQRFYHSDHLGTIRKIKNSTGTTVASHDYLPFGEEIGVPSGSEVMQYTGHERDSLGAGVEDDLDYMHHRYYGSRIGRFSRIDPLAASASPSDPQSWNRYAYVGNNPVTLSDPLGLFGSSPGICEDLYGDFCDIGQDDPNEYEDCFFGIGGACFGVVPIIGDVIPGDAYLNFPEYEVYLLTRPALSGANPIGKHMALFVWDPNTESIVAQYSLQEGDIRFDLNTQTASVDRDYFRSLMGLGGRTRSANIQLIKPPPGMTKGLFAQAVMFLSGAYESQHGYDAFLGGPNSNSAATFALHVLGANYEATAAARHHDYYEDVERQMEVLNAIFP